MSPIEIAKLLDEHVPAAMRWAGSVARRMRHFNIALENKATGNANTDALTLADLTVQELLIGVLRDAHPVFRGCRIEAEETTGDLARFATEGPCTIALDPIDGTKQYRDKTGNGYSIILTLRTSETLHYTLVFVPESGPSGAWVRVLGNDVRSVADDPGVPVRELFAKTPSRPKPTAGAKKIYLIGFQENDSRKAQRVTEAGLVGVAANDCPGCLYELLATGEYAGSLIHSPNVYDFPASLQIVRAWGGDSLWVDSRRPVNFEKLWLDERAKMLRLPGIVATSYDPQVLDTLCTVAENWNPIRYAPDTL